MYMIQIHYANIIYVFLELHFQKYYDLDHCLNVQTNYHSIEVIIYFKAIISFFLYYDLDHCLNVQTNYNSIEVIIYFKAIISICFCTYNFEVVTISQVCFIPPTIFTYNLMCFICIKKKKKKETSKKKKRSKKRYNVLIVSCN
jgi:hypothetical protein